MEHKDAVLLHMIGQSMNGAQRPVVTVSDVAKWFGHTRSWAHMKLVRMMEEGWVQRVENYHRSNAVKHTYELTPLTATRFKLGEYKAHYTAFILDGLSF